MMDNEEYAQVYAEFYPKVLRYLTGHMSSRQDAEDLAQNVLLKVYTKIESFDESKSSLSTWIFNITRNTLIDHQRSMSYRQHDELPEAYESSAADESVDILGGMVMEETLEELADALEQLTEDERNLIILHYYSKHTMLKIAEMMNRPYGQIKRLHVKALNKMKMYMSA